MPVDKFGRTGNTPASVRASVGAGVSINTINNHFLRRNGKNTVLVTIDMTGNGLKNVGDVLLPVGSDTVRELGCVDLTEGKGFSLPLGNRQNMLSFNISSNHQSHGSRLPCRHRMVSRSRLMMRT